MNIGINNATVDTAITDRLGQLLGGEDPAFFAEVEAVIGTIEWLTLRLTPIDGGYSSVATFFGGHVGGESSPVKTATIMQDGDDDDDFYASRDAMLAILKKVRGRRLSVQITPGGRLFDNEEPIPCVAPQAAAEEVTVQPVAASRAEIHVHVHVHPS